MADTFYTDEHEYIRVEDEIGTVGISDYAQNALGDIVYVELPKEGDHLDQGTQAGVVESVKSASEVYAPVAGEVIEVNTELEGNPVLVNEDPMEDGWFYKIKIESIEELNTLKDEAEYSSYVQGL